VAHDNVKSHFHLTPRGWVAGSEWLLDNVQNQDRPRPEDAVATYESCIYRRSPWSQEQGAWREVWRKVGVQDSEIVSLFGQFRMPREGGNVLPE
jgi:hypothetical protein